MKNTLLFTRSLTLVAFIVLMLSPSLGWGQLSISSNGTAFTQNFDAIGSSGTATLPSGWRVSQGTDFAAGTTATTLAYGTTGTGAVTGTSSGGTINWANGITGSSTDRAVGFLTSGSFSSPRNLYLQLTNNTGSTITSLAISFDIEKYRSGTRAWNVNFYAGGDGSNWIAQTDGDQAYSADPNNTTINNPPTSIAKLVTISGLSISNGASYYLRWSYTGSGGSTNSQGLGFDNFSITSTGGSSSPTVTTQAVNAIGTTTATGNGNITATGGVNATERGVCWDAFANPDPDINDSRNKETGDFGTGSYSIAMSSLSAETQYKVRAFATNPSGTSYGSAVNFWTLSVEPSAHSPTFTNSPQSQTQINLNYSAANTLTDADGYVILMKSGSAPTGVPVDGVFYTEGATLGDGTIVAVVNNTAAMSANITGLTAGTTYHFAIFPYNKGGVDATTNYKTDGTVPTTSGSTFAPLNATSEIDGPLLAGQPDPVLISSLVNTAGAAIRVFDMDMYDFGPDGQPTKITQLTIKPGTNNTVNWANTIEGVKLSIDGGSTYATIGSPTITTSSIVIPVVSGNLNIPDDDVITVSLYVYLKSSGLTDNQILEFKVDAGSGAHGFVTDATGSSFLSTLPNAPVSNQILIDVVASKLAFIQQPTNCNPFVAMSPSVTVAARDANDNLDLDYSANISITSLGTLSGSPVSAAAVSGISTFSSLIHTALGSGLTLTATSGSLTNASSASFSISSVLLVEDFNYTVGTDLTANGWNITGTNANPYISVSAPSINYSGYLSSNIGNEVSMTVSGQDVNRIITPQNSGSVYTSFLVNVSSASTGGDYFFHVGESTIGTTFRGRVFVKKDASNNLAFGIAQSATPNYTAFSYSLNTTYLIVLKYEIVSGTANDISAIYINPTLNANIPTIGWISNTDASGTDLSGLGSIALRQGNASAPTLKLDGIRVSTVWSDIVGVAAEPTNHPTNFTATGNTTNSITLTWTDAVGAQLPQKYLVKASASPANPVAPADGTPEADVVGQVYNVAYGVQTVTFTGLSSGTTYNFSIWPYTNTGASINYKTDGTPASTTASTQASSAGYFKSKASTGWSELTTWEYCATVDGTYADATFIPTLTDNVLIQNTDNVYVETALGYCNNLTIQAGARLSIDPGKNLTVAGTLTNNAGTSGLVISSDDTGTGSLIHSTAGVNATIQRYITGDADLTSMRYHLVSYPFRANYFSGVWTGSYLFDLSEASGQWGAVGANSNYQCYSNKGYLLYYPDASTTYTHTGVLKEDACTFPVTRTVASAYPGFNVLPNPYPCAIDFNVGAAWSSNIQDNKIWCWSASSGNYGAFIRSGSGTLGVTNIIPVGQAFFVQATASGNVTIATTAKTHSSQAYYKTTETTSNMLRLKTSANTFADEIIVQFRPEATTGYDAAMEAIKMTGQQEAPQLSATSTDGNNLSINALPFSNEDVIVPLNFSLVPAGEVSFTASGMESFESSVPMYLEDLAQSKVINLREQPTYAFSHTGGDAGQRFQLRFKGVNSTKEQPAAIPGSVFVSQGNLYIDVPSMQQNTVKVSVFDALGRALSTGTHTMSGMMQIPAPGAAGVYVVRVQDGNKIFTAKVVVQ